MHIYVPYKHQEYIVIQKYQNCFYSILCHKCVFGFEEEQYVATSFMACEPQHPLMERFLFLYYNLSFYDKNGKIFLRINCNVFF